MKSSMKAVVLCALAMMLGFVASGMLEPQTTTVEVELEEVEWSSVLYPELNDELNNDEADAAMVAAAEEVVGLLEDSLVREISGK